MTLRMMLLGLVASMGFELPSGADLSSWVNSTRVWVEASVADRSVGCVEAVVAESSPTDCRQALETSVEPPSEELTRTTEDLAFDAASTAMAADFVADLAAQIDEPAAEPTPMIAALVETDNVGLPDGEEQATLVIAEESTDEVACVDLSDEETVEASPLAEASDAIQERIERIHSAVQRTQEAVQAWAEVIQDPADETIPTR